MLTQVATKLVLDATALTVVEHSQAVSLEGGNAVFVDVQALSGSGTLTVEIEVSNDLENWSPIAGAGGGPSPTASTATSPANLRITATDISLTSALYCRLKYTVEFGGAFALAAGINVANL